MTWAAWQPPPEAEDPSQGGMTQLAAYDAGLTDDPGCWVQPVEVYWSPRLDPRSPEYDPQFVAEIEWEERGATEPRTQPEPHQPEAEPQPDWPEPELPF